MHKKGERLLMMILLAILCVSMAGCPLMPTKEAPKVIPTKPTLKSMMKIGPRSELHVNGQIIQLEPGSLIIAKHEDVVQFAVYQFEMERTCKQ